MNRGPWLPVVAFVLFGVALGGWIGISKRQDANPSTPSTGLHVYLSHGGRLVYLCQSGKPIQQVINCDNGESVLLTANLANELVLSTRELDK